MSPGENTRLRFEENMQQVAVGAMLRRRRYVWTIVKQKRRATSVELAMRCGRRRCVVHVMISCIYGPDLGESYGLQSVAPAPMQRELAMGGA